MCDNNKTEPGKMALQLAENAVDGFKKPVQPGPRKRKKVLDEDTYVKEVARIIERDFFPDLENIRNKIEFIEAKESNDIVKLRELYTKYSSGKEFPSFQNVEESPATFETPVIPQHPSNEEGAASLGSDVCNSTSRESKNTSSVDQKNEAGKDISLDEFLEKHTSEDNESFELIMKENERRFKAKYSWMFDAEEKHNEQHVPNLALPTAEQRAEAAVLAITGTSVQNDTRPKQVENWKFQTFSSVMFVPDGVPLSQSRKMELARRKKREISLPNTRYEGNPFTETLSQAAMLEASAVQASKKEGRVGIDGKELGKDSPKVNGYSFVTSPSPIPGVDASPLMTWGEVEGTPFQLDGSQTPLLKKNTPGPSYRIPKEPNRDRLGHKLAEEVSLKKRNKKNKIIATSRSIQGTPTNKFGQQSSFERMTSMSPAAQKLLKTKFGVNSGTDKALRASYTPSPSTRRGCTTPGPVTPNIALLPSSCTKYTPKSLAQKRTKPVVSGGEVDASSGLTDNLLDLPKRVKHSPLLKTGEETGSRKCAADFF